MLYESECILLDRDEVDISQNDGTAILKRKSGFDTIHAYIYKIASQYRFSD